MVGEVMPKKVEDHRYQGWIDIYNNTVMNATINQVTDVANNLYAKAGDCERKKMREFFKRGLELEIMFWDEMYSLA